MALYSPFVWDSLVFGHKIHSQQSPIPRLNPVFSSSVLLVKKFRTDCSVAFPDAFAEAASSKIIHERHWFG